MAKKESNHKPAEAIKAPYPQKFPDKPAGGRPKDQKWTLTDGPRNGDIIAVGPEISKYETMTTAGHALGVISGADYIHTYEKVMLRGKIKFIYKGCELYIGQEIMFQDGLYRTRRGMTNITDKEMMA